MKKLLLAFILIPSFAYAQSQSIAGTWSGKLNFKGTNCPYNITSELLTSLNLKKKRTYKIKKQGGVFIRTSDAVTVFSKFNKSYCSSESINFPSSTNAACTLTTSLCVNAKNDLLGVGGGISLYCIDSTGSEGSCYMSLGGTFPKKK